MKFVCYSDWHQLPENADALFEQGERDSLFYSRQWFESLAAAERDDDQTLSLACVVDGDTLLAILPLLRGAGHTGYALKHRYTTHFSLLLADADQQRILTCLGQGLSRLPLDGLLLEPVADDDRNINALQQVMAACGFSCERSFRFYNWIYRVQEESFADYMAARPARLRNTIARKQRKLEREHGYDIRLYTGTEVPQHLADYHAAYTASWKANEQYLSLLDDMVARFSAPGWSRLGVLYVNEQPIAAQLWFVLHGKANIFRLAYDKAWRQYSPGSILTRFLMAYVIDTDKVTEIDFLTGNDSYKQDWMSERRERFALSCVKPRKPAGRHERLFALLNRFRATR